MTTETISELKARGAFYTPEELTRFLAWWAIRTSDDRALEPSCGDGAFMASLADRYRALGRAALTDRLLGVERDPAEATKARLISPHADIRTLDFFDLEPSDVSAVDVAIGNPPYIRYHGFAGEERDKGLRRARQQGVVLTRLASSWAHFVVHAAAFLKENGRLALVLPAELLHADYSQPVREFLLRRFGSVIVVAFDRMVFPGAQVDAVLLLASSDDDHGLRIVRVTDAQSLADLDIASIPGPSIRRPRRWSGAVDPDAGRVYEQAVAKSGGQRLGTWASVDIGFVTGANDFFVLSADDARHHGLPPSVLTPAVRRPRDVPGLWVRPDDLSWLLNLAGQADPQGAISEYLAIGVLRGIPGRYKCRVRKPWFAVPLPRRRPDAFIPYMAHLGPRLIVNGVGAWSTNLLHGVSFHVDDPPVSAIATAMCSSLTLLSGEIEGRAYGGGVLKVETREAERLVVPPLGPADIGALAASHRDVDDMVRRGDNRSAAELVDTMLGLDHQELWHAYMVFRDRRLGRRNGHRATRS